MHKQEIMLKTYGASLDVNVFIDILKKQDTLIYLRGYHTDCMEIIKYDKSKVIVIDNKKYPYIKSELKRQNIIGENKGYVISNRELYPVYELTDKALSHL